MKWKKKVTCQDCGTENLRDYPYCMKCGGYLPPEKPMTLLAYSGTLIVVILSMLQSYFNDALPRALIIIDMIMVCSLIWVGLRALNKASEQSTPRVAGGRSSRPKYW